MRTKAIFSVLGRKLPSGKRVFYYQYYDKKGKRQGARSTGLIKKVEPVEEVAEKMKALKRGETSP